MKMITADQVIIFNKRICSEYGNLQAPLNKSLVEPEIGSAFFEIEGIGYVHGDVPEIAAALCFKIIKNHTFGDGNKRTAAISCIVFLNLNRYELSYIQDANGTEFHRLIKSIADNKSSEADVKQWFLNRTHLIGANKLLK
jgi:death-on-curing protein